MWPRRTAMGGGPRARPATRCGDELDQLCRAPSWLIPSRSPLCGISVGLPSPNALQASISIAQTAENCQELRKIGKRLLSLERTAVAADRLDDADYAAYTTGRAAEALGVEQAFLRALDAVGAVTPERSAGGHRRYTRRQLAFAGRIRELFDQGHTLASALRILGLQDDIVGLQDDLAVERARTASLRRQLRHEQGHGQGPPGAGPGAG